MLDKLDVCFSRYQVALRQPLAIFLTSFPWILKTSGSSGDLWRTPAPTLLPYLLFLGSPHHSLVVDHSQAIVGLFYNGTTRAQMLCKTDPRLQHKANARKGSKSQLTLFGVVTSTPVLKHQTQFLQMPSFTARNAYVACPHAQSRVQQTHRCLLALPLHVPGTDTLDPERKNIKTWFLKYEPERKNLIVH